MNVDLHVMLPAGEWANLQILKMPGMMANRSWAVFAKAKRIRDGGKPAFIKFILAASTEAGSDTRFVTSGARLKDLFERLKRIQLIGDAVPIVPLLEIKHTEGGLLIAMEEVTPLMDLIDRGDAYHLSSQILKDLDPDLGQKGWHHFDVCPNNIGILPDGHCVLIDVESFYLEADGKYKISVPAWKSFRAPSGLVADVENQLGAGVIERSLAARKLRFEIALAAAECVLGPIPSSRNSLDRSTVEAWIESAGNIDPVVGFWKQEILAAIETANFPPLQELRAKLESSIKSARESTGASLVRFPSVGAKRTQEVTTVSTVSPDPPQSGWSKEWPLMLPMVHALRAGRLGGKEIIEYREVLQQLAARYPTQLDVWSELLLVVISFEKNPELALSLANDALQHIPGSEDLIRTRNIVLVWARSGRKGEQNAHG